MRHTHKQEMELSTHDCTSLFFFVIFSLTLEADLQIIFAFLAALANPLNISAKVRDFSTLSSASCMLYKGSYHYNACTLAYL